MGLRSWVGTFVGSGGSDSGKQAAAPGQPATGAGAARLAELEGVTRQAREITVTARVLRSSGDPIEVEVRAGKQSARALARGKGFKLAHRAGPLLAPVLADLVRDLQGQGRLDVDSIACRSSESPVRGEKLKALCVSALCEAFGEPVPAADELAKRREAARSASREQAKQSRARKKELLALLSKGAEGVEEWNRRRARSEAGEALRKIDLAGKDLGGVDLRGCDLREAGFALARLSEARLSKADLRAARFANANLEGADLSGARAEGADFTGASLAGALWKHTTFDAATVWPQGFALPETLAWRGEGPSPAALAAITARKKHEGPVDLASFMKRLEAKIEKARMAKALSMLKKESFQLFVEAADERLAGVVKSQTDADLVYSCILAANGAFSCCTQNLNVCGGLRGAPCKHLLVLVIGVAQSGAMSADALDDWMQRSTLHQPTQQKDAQSAILLRYKGAEAGEIDWRPTETVPEDFYAY
jgi:hypothetical protein